MPKTDEVELREPFLKSVNEVDGLVVARGIDPKTGEIVEQFYNGVVLRMSPIHKWVEREPRISEHVHA